MVLYQYFVKIVFDSSGIGLETFLYLVHELEEADRLFGDCINGPNGSEGSKLDWKCI